MPHWARRRLYEDYDHVMHEDWIFGNHQIAYRYYSENEHRDGFYRVVMRERSGWFGVSKWYTIRDLREDEFELVCRTIRSIVDGADNEKLSQFIKDTDAREKEEEIEELKRKYCGFDLDGIKQY